MGDGALTMIDPFGLVCRGFQDVDFILVCIVLALALAWQVAVCVMERNKNA